MSLLKTLNTDTFCEVFVFVYHLLCYTTFKLWFLKGGLMLAIYIRVSTDEQKDRGHSIKQQTHLALEYIKNNENTIDYQIYDDAGFSAKTMDRPAMKQLLIDITSGIIDKVIFSAVDRISRNVNNTLYFIEHCAVNNVELVCTTTSVSTATPEDRMLLTMQALFAQLENEKISQRTKAGLLGGLQKGLYSVGGKVPFGYMRIGQSLAVNIYEAESVRHIFQSYAYQDFSVRSLAQHFKNAPVLPNGKKIPSHAISKMLTNTIYIGKIIRSNDAFDVAPPIISEELFSLVQQKLEKSTHIYTDNPYLFKNKLFCTECKTRMICVSTYKKNKRYLYYMCNIKTCCCYKKRINQEIVFEQLYDQLNKTLQKKSWLNAADQLKNNMLHNKIKSIHRAISQHENKSKRALDLFVHEAIEDHEFYTIKNEALKNIQFLQREIETLSKQLLIPAVSLRELKLEQLKTFIQNDCDNFYCEIKKRRLYSSLSDE